MRNEPIKAAERDIIEQRLHEDLIGPHQEEEVLTARPSDAYLTGILWPRRTKVGAEADERLGAETGTKNNTDNGSESEAVPASSTQRPSSAGISFCCAPNADGLCLVEVETRFSTYALTELPTRSWKRRAWSGTQVIQLSKGSSTLGLPTDIAPAQASLHIRAVAIKTGMIATITLVNDAEVAGSRDIAEEATLFQTGLTLRPIQGSALIPRPLTKVAADFEDEEVAINSLLYRNVHDFAAGHTCSVSWAPEKYDEDRGVVTEEVSTAWIPKALVKGIKAEGSSVFSDLGEHGPHADCLSARRLAEAPPELLIEYLKLLCDSYRQWIDQLKIKTSKIQREFRATAEGRVKECSRALERMQLAVGAIEKDHRLRAAFQMANLVMDQQSRWSRGDHAGALRWRPFQLGFVLLTCVSAVRRGHDDRNQMDLLWFPTGGGKTEAYLALIAMLAFYRRMSEDPTDQGGVAAFMRYTLRLLTTQQFARAAAMMSACEAVRTGKISSQHRHLLKGHTPFSIGLWVGSDATPNSREDAVSALLGGGEGVDRLASPEQLATCPCCKTRLKWTQQDGAWIQPDCVNKSCTIYGRLPIFTVDEDVYEALPTLVIGTVDKFAQIARNKESGQLFGGKWAPPDLILQDELHLISGPLGTIVGIYECAIDGIITRRGAKPKIIGSTATIKRAADQVLALFNRSAFQFPPPGIEHDDSGFSVVDPASPGRRYLAVTTAGRSAKFTLQAVAASLMQSAHVLKGHPSSDDYYTLLAYFNSLRELGGALVLFQDDVHDSKAVIAAARQEDPRKIEIVEELTSRRKQSELLDMFAQLETKSGGKQPAVDAVLATNMVSVGVDISRLGLMLVNGQPKSTAEYIQATSRVGRGRVSGLVVTVLNNAKARDRSHYETFQGWHQTVYRDVEATSVTPFAPRARDRALHAALVTSIRHLLPGRLDSPDLEEVDQDDLDDIIDMLVERASFIDKFEPAVHTELKKLLHEWRVRAPQVYWNDKDPNRSLMWSAEQAAARKAFGAKARSAWPTLNSMRSVEVGTPFRLILGLKVEDKAP